MPDELLARLRRFRDDTFPAARDQYQNLVTDGQHPTILFIGCSDSRLVPYLLTGTGPGDLFMVRNVGAFVPPHDGSEGYHGTAAAIEYAVLQLRVSRIVVCGHSHCAGIRALYEGAPAGAGNLAAWLELGREAALPVRLYAPEAPSSSAAAAAPPPADAGLRPEVLRRTEQRAVVLQLERLMSYPMVRAAVEARHLTLHGWHYVIEDGEVHVFDVQSGRFLPASRAGHSGTGPYPSYEDTDPARDGSASDDDISDDRP